MSKKRKQQNNKTINQNTIVANIPKLNDGETAYLTNLAGNYIISQVDNNKSKESVFKDYVNMATYDVEKLSHLYDRILESDKRSYSTTQEELSSLAKNTQTNINKIIKINSIVKYNINKDDIIGKTIEVIENNINTRYTMNYPSVKVDSKKSQKKEEKMKKELESLIKSFNKQINVEKMIIDCVSSTYSEGNFILYLKGDKDGYGFIKYPLGYVEITDRIIDGEPIVVFNVQKLKSEIQASFKKYGVMKSKQLVDITELVDKEIERDYPKEVSDAYKSKDKYTYLDPAKIGVVRINNLGQAYGLTPIFKALSPLLTLETIDNTDRKNISAKAKKIIFQKMREKGISEDGSIDIDSVGYAQASLLKAMQDDVVIYTANPFVESLEILEPKTDPTSNDVVLSNRNRVFNALGISFMTNESKQSMNTVKISYEDLLKTINKIVKSLEGILNKYYQVVCKENGFPVEYAPTISIHDTKLLDIDSQLKLVDLYYSKIGVSYKTVFENLGINYEEEVSRRKAENEEEFDQVIFIPHGNSYTTNSNEIVKDGVEDKNSNNSKKSDNQDKSIEDKDRLEAVN